MENISPWWIVAAVIAIVVVVLALRWAWHLLAAVKVERARELFRLQHERLEGMLLAAARATGKPRGLTWLECRIHGEATLVRDRIARQLVALVPVVIQFEPVADSDMEDVPAAREPRPATAVFTFLRGHWQTEGRIVFNLNPHQALNHFSKQLSMIESHH